MGEYSSDSGQLGLDRQVVGVYEGRQWAFIEEHLHDVLGKQSKAAGDLHGAVRHFLAMLPCPRSPPSWQTFYLRQFLDAATQLAASSKVSLCPMYPICCCNCLGAGCRPCSALHEMDTWLTGLIKYQISCCTCICPVQDSLAGKAPKACNLHLAVES